MNLYERMRHELMMTIASTLPHLNKDELCSIAQSFDKIAARYSISEAETHLAILGREEFIRVIKCFIVVKQMEGRTEKTLKRYLLVLKNFMETSTKPLNEITTNDIRLYLFQYQADRGVDNRTLECMRVVIGTFMRWATAEGYIERDPTVSLKPIKYAEKPREALEQIDLEILRRACRDARETALIEVFYSTGCRGPNYAASRWAMSIGRRKPSCCTAKVASIVPATSMPRLRWRCEPTSSGENTIARISFAMIEAAVR